MGLILHVNRQKRTKWQD